MHVLTCTASVRSLQIQKQYIKDKYSVMPKSDDKFHAVYEIHFPEWKTIWGMIEEEA